MGAFLNEHRLQCEKYLSHTAKSLVTTLQQWLDED
jgi:hypothetical protein